MVRVDRDAVQKLRDERRQRRSKMQQPDALVDVLAGIEEQLEELRYALIVTASGGKK